MEQAARGRKHPVDVILITQAGAEGISRAACARCTSWSRTGTRSGSSR